MHILKQSTYYIFTKETCTHDVKYKYILCVYITYIHIDIFIHTHIHKIFVETKYIDINTNIDKYE